eukprot:941139-Lingulodinium_polyedra.AAC.1
MDALSAALAEQGDPEKGPLAPLGRQPRSHAGRHQRGRPGKGPRLPLPQPVRRQGDQARAQIVSGG